jgi:photosystem II stability/assembly factor-like uncharacterized protein
MKYFVVALLFIYPFSLLSQKLPSVQILQDSIRSSFRGLSVPSDNMVWVSGSNGTVGRSTDGGKTWQWIIVPEFEKRDFRDIEAFDSSTAIIMAVDNPADILKTTDGGKTWKVVFHKEQEGMFLDAMDFKGNTGICVGDPLPADSTVKFFYLITTQDAGNTWVEEKRRKIKSSGDAIFAASGSNILLPSTSELKYVFMTGGNTTRLLGEWRHHHGSYSQQLPIMQGNASAGAFSLYLDKKTFYITGGDYNRYEKDSGNVVYSSDYGNTWKRSFAHGYRSCIIKTGKKIFITCGTNGVDMSFDNCRTWKLIHGDGAKGTNGFNVCAKSKIGKAVYFAGSGRIGKLVLH